MGNAVTWRHKLRAVAELCRLSNLPTAWADILCGWMVGRAAAGIGEWNVIEMLALCLLTLSSSGLYLSGMVWNDVFDVETDRLERPHRPIPSGRISRQAAIPLATTLMMAGWVASLCLSWLVRQLVPLILSTLLVTLILIYDAGGKRYAWGVVWLAACRIANVLLGGSLFFAQAVTPLSAIALVNGTYVLGLSLIARREVQPTSALAGVPKEVIVGTMALVFAMIGLVSVWLAARQGVWNIVSWDKEVSEHWWWVVASLGVAWALTQWGQVAHAIRRSEPRTLQMAVRRSLQGIIFLDAFLAFPLAGPVALLLILLWPIAVALGRTFPPT